MGGWLFVLCGGTIGIGDTGKEFELTRTTDIMRFLIATFGLVGATSTGVRVALVDVLAITDDTVIGCLRLRFGRTCSVFLTFSGDIAIAAVVVDSLFCGTIMIKVASATITG